MPGSYVKKILIVEDDRKAAQALELRVRSAGYEPSTAYDALSGVVAAAKVQPDAVLLDVTMPKGNGFSVALRIQAILPAHTPIVFVTASRRPEFFDRAMKLEACGYFEKPYDAAKLLELLHSVLEAKPAAAGTNVENPLLAH